MPGAVGEPLQLTPGGAADGEEGRRSSLSLPLADEAAGASPTHAGFLQRSFGQMTINGVRHSMLTLVSTALGGGVLSVSYVMRLCGVVVGSAMLMIGASLAFLSTQALMRMSNQTHQSTYAGLFAQCAGNLAGPILDGMIFVYGNGSCVGYLVFIGDFVPSLLALLTGRSSPVASWRPLSIIAAGAIVYPLAMQKDVSILRFMAPVSLLSLIYMALVIAVYAPSEYAEHIDKPGFGPIEAGVPTIHLLDGFSLCIFAYNCHTNVVPVAGTFIRPTKARILKVSAVVNVVQLLFYVVIGVTGYLSFLGDTQQDIIKNYAPTAWAVAGGRLMLTFTMMVALAVNIVPAITSGIQIRDYICGGEPLAPSPSASLADSNGAAPPPPAPETSGKARRLRIILATGCMLCQVFLAIKVPGVADILGLLGASVATAIMLAIPAYLMGKIAPKTRRNYAQQCLLWTFAAISLASIPVKVLTWTGVIS